MPETTILLKPEELREKAFNEFIKNTFTFKEKLPNEMLSQLEKQDNDEHNNQSRASSEDSEDTGSLIDSTDSDSEQSCTRLLDGVISIIEQMRGFVNSAPAAGSSKASKLIQNPSIRNSIRSPSKEKDTSPANNTRHCENGLFPRGVHTLSHSQKKDNLPLNTQYHNSASPKKYVIAHSRKNDNTSVNAEFYSESFTNHTYSSFEVNFMSNSRTDYGLHESNAELVSVTANDLHYDATKSYLPLKTESFLSYKTYKTNSFFDECEPKKNYPLKSRSPAKRRSFYESLDTPIEGKTSPVYKCRPRVQKRDSTRRFKNDRIQEYLSSVQQHKSSELRNHKNVVICPKYPKSKSLFSQYNGKWKLPVNGQLKIINGHVNINGIPSEGKFIGYPLQ